MLLWPTSAESTACYEHRCNMDVEGEEYGVLRVASGTAQIDQGRSECDETGYCATGSAANHYNGVQCHPGYTDWMSDTMHGGPEGGAAGQTVGAQSQSEGPTGVSAHSPCDLGFWLLWASPACFRRL